jgi:GTPase involved in cell partitioning and DNA repair
MVWSQLLLYVLDASASEKGRTPAQDLKALVQELSLYDDSLLEKPALVFANKYDLDGMYTGAVGVELPVSI